MAGAGNGTHATAARTARRTGGVIGVGLVGALDEIVFHQLLQWHHFYVHAEPFWRIFSDGAFHAFTTAMLAFGVALLWWHRGRFASLVGGRPFWSGVLVGAGAFQLFDGVVDHKILGIHPVRVGADPMWPYDLAWLAGGAILLLAGWVLGRGRLPGPRSAAGRR